MAESLDIESVTNIKIINESNIGRYKYLKICNLKKIFFSTGTISLGDRRRQCRAAMRHYTADTGGFGQYGTVVQGQHRYTTLQASLSCALKIILPI